MPRQLRRAPGHARRLAPALRRLPAAGHATWRPGQGAPWDPRAGGAVATQSRVLDFLADACRRMVGGRGRRRRQAGRLRPLGRARRPVRAVRVLRPSGPPVGAASAASCWTQAFPAGRGDVRAIIATTDMRAQARYYRAGTAARFPILSLIGAPGAIAGSGPLDGRLEAVRGHGGRDRSPGGAGASVLEFDRGDEFELAAGRARGVPLSPRRTRRWATRFLGPRGGIGPGGGGGSGRHAARSSTTSSDAPRSWRSRRSPLDVPGPTRWPCATC